MELKEIIAWIESTIKFLDSDVKFYNSENDIVSADFFYQESIKYKKVLEYLKELQDWRAGILNDDRRSD